MPIDVRDGSFAPKLIKKGQTRIDGMDDKIIGLYVAGLPTRDIRLKRFMGSVLAPTSSAASRMRFFKKLPTGELCPGAGVVLLDALRVKVGDAASRQVKNKAGYVALAITAQDNREVLGLAANEGAKLWLSVMNNLRNRGVEDILAAVVDGLNGFPETTVKLASATLCATS